MKKLKGTTVTYLAFMEENKIVKIGKTKDFESRKSQLNTANPYIKSYYVIPFDVEHLLHCNFYKNRVKGEWFIYQNKNVFLDKIKTP